MFLFEQAQPASSAQAPSRLELSAALNSEPYEHTPQGDACASYGKRVSAIHGDLYFGYLIVRARWGRYCFVHFAPGQLRPSRHSYPTELEATEAIFEELQIRGERYPESQWARKMAKTIEEGQRMRFNAALLGSGGEKGNAEYYDLF